MTVTGTAAVLTVALSAAFISPVSAAGGSAAGVRPDKPPKRVQRVLRVGPKRDLKRPSEAARVARYGDRIEIDAGEYKDCAVWRANRLTFKGVGGLAHVRDVACQDKAIWVIQGSNAQVIGVRFSGARSSHKNGAGIRFEGTNLRIANSHFHDNENGILTGTNYRSRIIIRNSVFERNGKCEPDCAHGIYIGHIRELVVIGSTFRDQRVGHHIKSRAGTTKIVGNRILDGHTGTASYSINVPNGGTVLIRSNFIHQGRLAENGRFIVSIGEEGATNTSRGILIERNSFVNDHSGPTVFVRNMTRQIAILRANTFRGVGTKLNGRGRIQ